MPRRTCVLAWLLGLSSCTRVSASIDAPAAEPAATSTPTSEEPEPDPWHGRWYGDLRVTPREVVEVVEQPQPEGDTAELPPPTPEELAAWDRKSPDAEAPLREWDRANVAMLSAWWRELQCFHLAIVSVGNSTFNSNDAQRWQAFSKMYQPRVIPWISSVLSGHPELLSNSKAIARLLEAHELLSYQYPDAFEAGDAWQLQLCDEQWTNVARALDGYLGEIGASDVTLDREDGDDLAACRALLDAP